MSHSSLISLTRTKKCRLSSLNDNSSNEYENNENHGTDKQNRNYLRANMYGSGGNPILRFSVFLFVCFDRRLLLLLLFFFGFHNYIEQEMSHHRLTFLFEDAVLCVFGAYAIVLRPHDSEKPVIISLLYTQSFSHMDSSMCINSINA